MDLRDFMLAPFCRRKLFGGRKGVGTHGHRLRQLNAPALGIGVRCIGRWLRCAGRASRWLPIRVWHNKFKHVGALERINALFSQQADRVKIGSGGKAMLLRHAPGHAQLAARQAFPADGVDVGLAARLRRGRGRRGGVMLLWRGGCRGLRWRRGECGLRGVLRLAVIG